MNQLHLEPMNHEEFVIWKIQSLENYAKEKEKEGLSPEDARETSEASFKRLLPDDEKSKDQYVYKVMNGSNSVGILWWGVQAQGSKKNGWIYDVMIDESFRGKGYGKGAMQLAARDVKEKGYSRLGLHVFGHNEIARKLYQSLEYKETNVIMYKDL